MRPTWLGSPLPALEFLSTLRFRLAVVHSPEALAAALWAFPLVGLLIGLALFGLERGLRELAPDPATMALVLVAWVGLTGGLHLDGLADAADGLFGGRNREQRLAIMRDLQTGTWGVLALLLALIAKFGLLLALPEAGRFAALLFAPAAARGLVVGAMALVPYARPEGYGRELHTAARGRPALLAMALAAAIAAIVAPPEGLVALVVAGAAIAAVTAYARARLGGLTGDVDGALIEIGELAALLTLVVAFHEGWASPIWSG